MDIVKELIRVIPTERYNHIIVYLGGMPIVRAEFHKKYDISIITNNMKDLGHYKLEYVGNINDFINEVNNILVHSGVDELIKKSEGSKITFRSCASLNGEINKDSIIIEQDEKDNDNTGEGNIVHKRYEINASISLSGHTLSNVIGVFVFQYFV
jgi:hypothetical protein